MTDQELKDLVASLAEDRKETSRQIRELNRAVGAYGNVEGKIFEDQIFHSFQRKPILKGVVFEDVERNWRRAMHGVAAEYDVVLLNGSFVGVVETKRKLEREDVEKFAEAALPAFKKLYPDLKDKKIIGAIATATVDARVLTAARDLGVMVLTPEGQDLKVLSDSIREF